MPRVEQILQQTRRKPIFGEDIVQHLRNHKVKYSMTTADSQQTRRKPIFGEDIVQHLMQEPYCIVEITTADSLRAFLLFGT